MSGVTNLGGGLQALVAAMRDLALDPLDQIQLLTPLATFQAAETYGGDTVGRAQAAAQAGTAAFGRRAALAAIGRAVAQCRPPSYDEAVALRDAVCGLIDAEVTFAGDTGDDASCTALRNLKTGVADHLTAVAADLARLRQVRVGAPLPCLVHAYRLYGDAGRSDEVADYAGAEDPNFLPPEFHALGR